MSTTLLNRALVEFESALSKRGHRLTEARRLVLSALVLAGGHVSADELFELVRKGGFDIGRMTVYRTLDLLTELGLVRPVYQGTGAAHFILLVEGHHHHLVCTECNRVIEVDACMLPDIRGQVVRGSDFEVKGHLLEIFGRCRDCRA